MDSEILRRIDSFVEENRENIFRDIARLVAVESTKGESAPGAPYGPGPAAAMREVFAICEKLGLDTRNCENRMAYAQVGQGDEYLATITHVDVVPAGEGWKADPFTMRERDGYIIGRGVIDDKGPAVLCLYALKFLRDSAVELRYPVRALMGLDEEDGMSDLDYYLKNYPAPLFCFSPDSAFPLCVGEKGILHGRIAFRAKTDKIAEIRGGIAANVIPSVCEAWVRADKLNSTQRVHAVYDDKKNLWHLTASGVGGHASLPEGTVNAIGVMTDYLLENAVTDGEERDTLELLHKLHSAYDGSALGIAASDGVFTPLTAVGGVIGMEEGRIFQSIDIRYPTSTTSDQLLDTIRRAAGELAEVTVALDKPPFLLKADDPAVRCCMEAYNTVTHEEASTYTTGGGTYARKFPRAAAFGPEHPERPAPEFAGGMHGAEEAACMADLIEALKIYILTLLELEKLDY